jgi:hypothetical protein
MAAAVLGLCWLLLVAPCSATCCSRGLLGASSRARACRCGRAAPAVLLPPGCRPPALLLLAVATTKAWPSVRPAPTTSAASTAALLRVAATVSSAPTPIAPAFSIGRAVPAPATSFVPIHAAAGLQSSSCGRPSSCFVC